MDRATVTAGYLDALAMTRTAPELSLLQELIRRHVARFAFCSVGPRLGDELPLELEAVYDRIVVRARGGYCFEQNALFHAVLEELGFEVRLCLARVIYNQDIHPPLTHRITLVRIDGQEYVSDVGFGPLGPPVPVSTAGRPPLRAEGTFRVHERRPGEFHLQAFKDGGDFSLYRFAAGDYGPADCELGHFYSHRHPQAAFVNNLVASRILPDEIRSLRNRHYWVIRPVGSSQTTLASAAQLRRLLEHELGIQITDSESVRLYEATS
jgi:N-hydroxyarylamine O-acetyltransferase